MDQEKGNISINAENIFPIIKKWLYSEKDIFLRELVSNASDAISKMKKLSDMGEAKDLAEEKYTITVTVNKKDKTLKIVDNGLGMTAEEVKKYINQVAFSGAKDFMEKYKDKADESQIIGHFGLGFYSAFMVSEKVRIDTLSFEKEAKAVSWTSQGGTEFEIGSSDRTNRGTTITLSIAEDSVEFLEFTQTREVMQKYFSFLPYELFVINEEDNIESQKLEPINDINPLWNKNPKDCTPEEYKAFYSTVFKDFNEPLFWIHLNMDYPFKLKGILFFPRLKNGMETLEGQIKLYYNQVFVANNIKEVIPDYLMLLKGTIDCPDLPLNVSRSFLQNDGYVAKISSHITKKVADRLTSLFENERESFNKYWEDINPFVKYGCIKDEKFLDRVKDILVFKTSNGEHLTLKDYIQKNKEKHENKVFYVTDENQQAHFLKVFKEHDMEAVIMNNMIDSHYMQTLEVKNPDIKFQRIDSDISETLTDKSHEETEETKGFQIKLEKLFKMATDNENLKVKYESFKNDAVPCVITLDEHIRRMKDMNMYFGGGNDMSSVFANEKVVILNKKNSIIESILKLEENGKTEDANLIAKQVYDIAMLSHEQLKPEAMVGFIERSNEILARFAKLD